MFIRFLLFSSLCLSAYSFEKIILTTTKETSLEELQKIEPSINERTLSELNKFRNPPILEEQKDLVISPKVRLGFCKYEVRMGDWLVSLLRRYGYRAPYSLDLIYLAEDKNKLEDMNFIEVGQKILIPFLYIPEIGEKYLSKNISCVELDKSNRVDPFIVKDRNAHITMKNGSVTFHPSYVHSRNQQEIKDKKKPDNVIGSIITVRKRMPLELELTSGVLYDSIHEDMSDNTIISSPQLFIAVEALVKYSDSVKIGLGMNIVKSSYAEGISTKSTLVGKENILLTGYLKGSYKFGAKYNFSSKVGVSQITTFTVNNGYTIIKKTSPFIEANLDREMTTFFNYNLDLRINLKKSFKAQEIYNGGISYGIGTRVSSQKYPLGIKMLYHFGNFKTDSLKYEHRWLEIAGDYTWTF